MHTIYSQVQRVEVSEPHGLWGTAVPQSCVLAALWVMSLEHRVPIKPYSCGQ